MENKNITQVEFDEQLGIYVPLSQLRKVVNSLKDFKGDTKISFIYILLSLFPNVYDSIHEKLNQFYTQGYLDGIASKNETEEICNEN